MKDGTIFEGEFKNGLATRENHKKYDFKRPK